MQGQMWGLLAAILSTSHISLAEHRVNLSFKLALVTGVPTTYLLMQLSMKIFGNSVNNLFKENLILTEFNKKERNHLRTWFLTSCHLQSLALN